MKCEKWVRIAVTILLMTMGFALFYALIMWFSTGTDAMPFVMIPYYLVLGGALFVLIMGITANKCYLPVCVSFGSTRRDAIFGLQIMERLPAMAVILISVVVCMIFRNDVTRGFMALWLPMFCLLICAGSLGGIIGCIGVRFGRIGMILSVIIFIMCGMAGGFIGGFTAGGGVFSFGLNIDISKLITIISAILAVVLWAVELILMTRILKKYEVKL